MHTVDANPSQVVPAENLLSSSPGDSPASAPQAAPGASAPPVGNAGKTAHRPSQAWKDVRENSAEAAYCKVEGLPLWKRVLDVTCILLSLAFWLPLVILVAFWVKVVSTGPIFFRQERVGYRGSR